MTYTGLGRRFGGNGMLRTDEATGPSPVRKGIFAGDLRNPAALQLAGSRCSACAEATLGENSACPNCGSEEVRPIVLSNEGSVWTYTVVRHKPPGDYKGPEPFAPFALGLIDLPDGLRVVAPIAGDVDRVQIGTKVRFHAYARPDGVVEFNYLPVA